MPRHTLLLPDRVAFRDELQAGSVPFRLAVFGRCQDRPSGYVSINGTVHGILTRNEELPRVRDVNDTSGVEMRGNHGIAAEATARKGSEDSRTRV